MSYLEKHFGKPLEEITDEELQSIAEATVPYGYCHCGCGQKTNLHTFSDASKGHVRGEPKRFINGHQNRGPLNGQFKTGWRDKVEKPSGFCECGCGQLTNISPKDIPHLGVIAGYPLRFIKGHARKGKGTPSRPTAYTPNHPRANKAGRVLEQFLVVEKALGKHLPEGAQVHHIDGNYLNNKPNNLVVCQDQAYHSLLHQRQRALESCGNPNWLRCDYCGKYSPPEDMVCYQSKNGRGRHRECIKSYMAEWEKRGRRGSRSTIVDLDDF
jgi:hypothetical protein